MKSTTSPTPFHARAGFVWLLRLVFGVAYFLVYRFFVKENVVSQIPLDKLTQLTTQVAGYKTLFGLFGFVLGLFALIINAILRILKRIIIGKRAVRLLPILTAISYGVFARLGYRLVYFEPRYTEIGILIILYLGKALRRTAASMVGFSLVWFIFSIWESIIKKIKGPKTKAVSLILIMAVLPFLGGCDSVLARIGQEMCRLAPDTDHCFQRTATQSANPKDCAKIKGTKFKDMGSNPPRDKCYLQVAINKGDYKVCSNIKGGMMSYTQDECIRSTSKKMLDDAIIKDDPNLCKKLGGFPSGYQEDASECKRQLCSPSKLESMDSKMQDLTEKAKNGDSDAKKELQKLKQDKQTRYEQMTDAEKGTYFKTKKDAMLATIEDEDVKSAIAKEYTNRRNASSPTKIDSMTDKLAEVIERQKTAKELDDKANEMMDDIKNQMIGYVEKQKDDAIDEVIGVGKDAAEKWIKENGGDDLKVGLLKVKRMAEKYDKASKEYEGMMKQYNKMKATYDEVMGTYKRIDQISDMVAQGKIDEGKAKVLKGAVLLDKGLEYTTAYVPVFGSTISTVSKETFGVVIEVAKKRAERSTAIEKCFDDPANCDTEKISAY